jgi:hypothetical protein
MVCDHCAAHDTLVRRSLMVARSLPALEPSPEFQARLRARLAACREEEQRATAPIPAPVMPARRALPLRSLRRPARTAAVVAAGAVIGALAFRAMVDSRAGTLSIQPTIASRPTPVQAAPYISPQVLQVMSTGNPVWPAAMMIDDVPMQAMSAGFSTVSTSR